MGLSTGIELGDPGGVVLKVGNKLCNSVKMKVLGGFVALLFLVTLRATAVITEIVLATPKQLGDFTKIVDSAPKEVEEAAKIIDTAPEQVEEDNKIIDVSLKEKNESPAREYCGTCVKVDSICYNRSYLFELTAPFRQEVIIKKMGILRSKNILFYSFEPTFDDPEYFKVAYVSIDSRTSVRTHFIKGKKNSNFGVFDINQRENKIYLGGSDGVWFVENPNKKTPVPRVFADEGKISNVISRDYVYFTKLYYPGIIKDIDGIYHFILKDTMIENFVVDKDVEYNVVYVNGTGLFGYNSKTQDQVKLSDNRFFRGLTVDLDGVVYAWYIDGIYKVFLNKVYSHSNLTRVSSVEVGAMAFDQSNNIIYSKEKSLYKLTNLYTTEC